MTAAGATVSLAVTGGVGAPLLRAAVRSQTVLAAEASHPPVQRAQPMKVAHAAAAVQPPTAAEDEARTEAQRLHKTPPFADAQAIKY